jgi:hypothetical protein
VTIVQWSYYKLTYSVFETTHSDIHDQIAQCLLTEHCTYT